MKKISQFINYNRKISNQKFFSTMNTVYLALGSNLGKRFKNFVDCTKLIEERSIGRIIKTSQIYESPCINENNKIEKEERKFINAVIKIQTSYSPMGLLKACKDIEKDFNRKPKTKYHEEREIDIDILTYNNDIIDITDSESSYQLNIPHPRLTERLFVLKPLLDIDLNMEIIDRQSNKLKSVKKILKELISNKEDLKIDNFNVDNIVSYDKLSYLSKVFYLNTSKDKEKYFNVSNKTLLMATINCTPDSFSIGWLKSENPYDKIIEYLVKNKDQIDIIDIGGESTRPGAHELDSREEIKRIVPLIEKIKANDQLDNIPISIDTRKSSVVREAIKLGADIINDVSGAQFDPEMADLISENNLPYICMHSRTIPEEMQRVEFLKYSENITEDINREIQDKINEIKLKRGNKSTILDWNIIIDPGIGFSKTTEHNISILKNLEKIKMKFPNLMLIGHSKKKFIREILNVDVKNTLPGDIVVASTAISKGANIIRIHDVENLSKALKISDKLYK